MLLTHLLDGQGSSRLRTSANRAVGVTSDYTAFGWRFNGNATPDSAPGWGAASGYRTDGPGPANGAALIKVGCRFYDPEFGVFLTRDTDLDQKPYAYCDDDPINATDPSGHLAMLPNGMYQSASECLGVLMGSLASGTFSLESQQQQTGSPSSNDLKKLGATLAGLGTVISWIPTPGTLWGGRSLQALGITFTLEGFYGAPKVPPGYTNFNDSLGSDVGKSAPRA